MPRLATPDELRSFAFGTDLVEAPSIVQNVMIHAAMTIKLPRPPYNIYRTDAMLRRGMARKAFTSFIGLDEALRITPPPEDIRASNALPWTEWLAKLPEDGGATPPDRRALLAWNLEKSITDTEECGPAILERISRFDECLDDAVADGRIAPRMQTVWRGIQGAVRVFCPGPLDTRPGIGGTAFKKSKILQIVRGYHQNRDIIGHECTHFLGGFAAHCLEEPATNILTKAIQPEVQGQNDYLLHEELIAQALAQSAIQSDLLSEIFCGRFEPSNELRLTRLVRRRLGYNALGDHISWTKKEMKRLHTQQACEPNLRMFFTGLQAIHLAAGKDYQAIMRERLPDADEQAMVQISQQVEALYATPSPAGPHCRET